MREFFAIFVLVVTSNAKNIDKTNSILKDEITNSIHKDESVQGASKPSAYNYPYVNPPADRPDGLDNDCLEYPCLIWEDQFDFLDFEKWQHEITAGGGGNWEFQYYTNNRSNSYTRDSTLYLKPTLTEDKMGPGSVTSQILDIWGATPANECTGNGFYGCFRVGSPSNPINPVQSARLRTAKSFAFKYGKVEVSARMPKGDWIWPAIWLLPVDEAYGGWPASGEIDIVESRGNLDMKNEQGQSMGNDHMGATLHWGPYFPKNGYSLTTGSKNDDYGDNFHKYGLEWSEDGITLSVDDQVVLDVPAPQNGFWNKAGWDKELPDISNPWRYEGTKMAPFDREFHFIMNVAVGGTNGFFPDTWTNSPYPKPWSNASPTAFAEFWNAKNSWYPTWNPEKNNGEEAAMAVEYIKVWKTKPNHH